MTVLHEVLNSQGHHLLEVHWSELFQIICRLFDNERLPNNAIEREEWLKTTCNLSLCCATELLIKFYNRLPKEVLQEFYCAVKWCATADNEHLLRMSLENFENFVISKGNNFDKKQWTATLKTLHELFKVTTPVELVTPSTDTQSIKSCKQIVILKCMAQIKLLSVVENILFWSHFHSNEPDAHESTCKESYLMLDFEQLEEVKEFVENCYQVAHVFNCNHLRKTELWQIGFTKRLPHLLKQESKALHLMLVLLHCAYDNTENYQVRETLDTKIMVFGNTLFTCFLSEESERNRELWVPLLTFFLRKLVEMTAARFVRHLKQYYQHLLKMMGRECKLEIRTLLSNIFAKIYDEMIAKEESKILLEQKSVLIAEKRKECDKSINPEEAFSFVDQYALLLDQPNKDKTSCNVTALRDENNNINDNY
jgi:hypothetical protein